MDRRIEMVLERLIFGAQFRGGQLPVGHAGKKGRAAMPQIRREKIQFRAAQMVAADRVVGNFLELPGQGGVLQPPRLANSWQVSQRVPVSRL